MKRTAALGVVLVLFGLLAVAAPWRRIARAARNRILDRIDARRDAPLRTPPPDEDWTLDEVSLLALDRRLGAPAAAPGASGVTVRLHRVHAFAKVVSFGVPLPRSAVSDVARLDVRAGGAPLACDVAPLLWFYDEAGRRMALRAVRIQFPAEAMRGGAMDVEVSWAGEASGRAEAGSAVRFGAGASFASPVRVRTRVRSIEGSAAGRRLVEGPEETRTLFVGREPSAVALFPPGYLAQTGLLGALATKEEAARPEMAGLSFLSQAAADFGLDAMHALPYAVDPDSVADPKTSYEGWLYDRCATFLVLHAHSGDSRFLRHALRSCSFFARQIELSGPNAGTFRGKPEPDLKYSHLRGLFAYYALTGDEAAREAGEAIARAWLADRGLVQPYAAGRLRGPDRLWNERLLATAMEALLYGHRLTGEPRYLETLRRLVDTAHRHVTGDAAALAALNPGVGPYPPQDCLVHSAAQHGEGEQEPWCSGWMTELLIDPLLGYQEQTGDARVDEILVRLTRFLRDAGSQYFRGDPGGDSFARPSTCFDGRETAEPRILVPAYGAGVSADGRRALNGEWTDFHHCADATALSAAGLRAWVRRTGKVPALPADATAAPGTLADEGQAVLLLHHELAHCARWVFESQTRRARDPLAWDAAMLARAEPADARRAVTQNRIGWPVHALSVDRELSWWFNTSLLQFRLLREAGIAVPELRPGLLQPPGCSGR